MKVDPGFRADHLIAVNFTISTTRHGNGWLQYYRDVIDKARTVPGVISAAAVKDAPFRGNGERNSFGPPGYVAEGRRGSADRAHDEHQRRIFPDDRREDDRRARIPAHRPRRTARRS